MTETVSLPVPAGGSVVIQHGIRLPDGTHLWEVEIGAGKVPLPDVARRYAGQDHVWLPGVVGPARASSWELFIEGWRTRYAGLGLTVDADTEEPIVVARKLALIVGRTSWSNEETPDPIEKPNAVIGLVTSTSSTHGGIDVEIPDGPVLDRLRERAEKSPVLVTLVDNGYPTPGLLVTHAPSEEASAAVVSTPTEEDFDAVLHRHAILSAAVSRALGILDSPDPKVRNRVREALREAVDEIDRLGREYRGEPEPVAGLA